jgi:hypothetical protein
VFRGIKILLLIILFSKYSYAQNDSLRFILQKSLNWLAENQEKTTVKDSVFAGEWPSTMGLKNGYILLGKAKPYRDSNCFTQANVYNTLAEMFLADSTLKLIPKMLLNAGPEILTYKNENAFNFWKQLKPNRPLSKGDSNPENYLAHRPTNYKLKTRFINNAADIANDADDTSTGNLSLFYKNIIFGVNEGLVSQNVYDSYIDGSRNNYHWYNFIHKIPRPGNAYMTWLAPEHQFKNWSFPWQVAHNLVFYLPGSSCFPHSYSRYVPWGANDVDAVVNCNVLNYLAKTDQLTNAKGKEGALKLLKHVVKKERWSRAGTYYPNRFYIHFSISKIYPYFKEDLKNEAELLLEHLITSQKENGAFHSRWKANKKDILQSTVYALNAMLNLRNGGIRVPQENLDRAVSYIKSEMREDFSWEGGVFFSGGTVVRNVLFFKSDAYTTALICQAIQKYLKEI